MSNFFTELEEQLRSAGDVRAATVHRTRTRTRKGTVIGLVAVVVSAPAVAASTGWHPFLGDGTKPAPASAATPVPDTQEKLLAVLERKQNDADREAARTALRFLSRDVDGVRTGGIRALSVPSAPGPVILIPVERYDVDSPGLPAGAPHRTPKRDGLCLFAEDPQDGGGWSCFSAAQVADGDAVAGIGSTRYGLLPNGIKTLEIDYSTGKTIRVPVEDNAFGYVPPRNPRPNDRTARFRETQRWLSPTGTTIRSRTGPALLSLSGVETRISRCDPAVPPDQCAMLKAAPGYVFP